LTARGNNQEKSTGYTILFFFLLFVHGKIRRIAIQEITAAKNSKGNAKIMQVTIRGLEITA
jgi:hypothetical protein